MGARIVDRLELDLANGYRLEAELAYGRSPFRSGPYVVGCSFVQSGGMASTGVALDELVAPDYWGRCADGSLAILPHAGKGKGDPDASGHKLTAGEADVLLSWLRLAVDGVAEPGRRQRLSPLGA